VLASLRVLGFFFSSCTLQIGSVRCKWVSQRQNGSDSFAAGIIGLQTFPFGLVMILQWIFEKLLG